jgi:hypothetical protein
MPKNNVSDPITDQEIAFARFNVSRDQVLDRLWEIANLAPEMTRSSITGQVKALSMIIAIEGLIPDRRAASAQNKSAHPPVTAQIYTAEWLRNRQSGENVDPQPPSPAAREETASEPQPASGSADGAPPTPEPTLDPSQPTSFAAPLNPSQTTSWVPRVPMADYVAPDTRLASRIQINPFARRR